MGYDSSKQPANDLENAVLTTPKVVTSINDENGNEMIGFVADPLAVNNISVINASTGIDPIITVEGDGVDHGIEIASLGLGSIKITAEGVPCIEASQNLVPQLGFYGAIPVAQPAPAGSIVGFIPGVGTPVTDDATFSGGVGLGAYTIDDIVKGLKDIGILAV